MRDLKAVRYLVLAASVLAVMALAACGSSGGGNINSDGGGGGGNINSDGGGGNSNSNSNSGSSGSVTGTITWPDGQPAANASVYFYNYVAGFSASGWSSGGSNGQYQVQQLPAGGSYSLTGCPCSDLTAYIYVPAAVMSPGNGGWDCWIIMQDDNQNYSGREANPGDVINWQALNLPCSRIFYTSDQPTVQSEATTVLPSLNSGPWQTAEQLTSGGGSG